MQTQFNQTDCDAMENFTGTKNFDPRDLPYDLDDLLTRIQASAGKKSFLVFDHNKYLTVPTRNIAYFYVKYESPKIVCFDKHEYFVNYSLEQIRNLVTEKQFFRVNRQYLINFSAIKEVEHYFARKLLVNLVVPIADKMLVAREKASGFLQWLENR
ncbi:MAG: LytTR family DNA-binding domain-containing protein [Ferruginibacter sp.]|nr:LytTR family DNA-binding domain-containing protein [Ferruginibacter sp.]